MTYRNLYTAERWLITHPTAQILEGSTLEAMSNAKDDGEIGTPFTPSMYPKSLIKKTEMALKLIYEVELDI